LEVFRFLRKAGWRVVRVWEHELARRNEGRLVGRLRKFLVLVPINSFWLKKARGARLAENIESCQRQIRPLADIQLHALGPSCLEEGDW